MRKETKQVFMALGLFLTYAILIVLYPTVFMWSWIPTFAIAVPTTTVYLHRAMTHHACQMPAWMRNIYETGQWIAIGSKTDDWVFVHRKHHVHSDRLGDPHSPLLEGLVPAILPFNVFPWREFIRVYKDQIPIYTFDIRKMKSPYTAWISRHTALGLASGMVLMCILQITLNGLWVGIGKGLLASGFHVVTYVFILNPLINGLCHHPHKWLGGYQHIVIGKINHEWMLKALRTYNNWIVAFLTAGEGFHRNHHVEHNVVMLARTIAEMPADWGYWLFIWPFIQLGVITKPRYPTLQVV